MPLLEHERTLFRRSFLSRIGAAFAATGAALSVTPKSAYAQASVSPPWSPARHSPDDWLDRIPGGHRFVFDTTSPETFSSVLQYANNYFIASQTGYGLKNDDLAVVIVARHHSTQFAYNSSIWTKYRAELVKAAEVTDLPDFSDRLAELLKRGVHVAVCQMATRRIAASVAKSTGSSLDGVYDELAANLVRNAHLVPAGIVAVNRAQERGYSFASA